MSRDRREWSWLCAFAIVAGAVMLHPAAQAADGSYVPGPEYTPGPRTVVVKDSGGGFEPQTTRMLVNAKVTFVLDDEAQQKHVVDFCNPHVPCEDRWELDPAGTNARQFTRTFTVRGDFGFRCTLHGTDGVVKVREPAVTAATSRAPSPSATTAPTSAARRPPADSTTTTVRPTTTTTATSAAATPAAKPGASPGASQSTPATITTSSAPLQPAATTPLPAVVAAEATAAEHPTIEAVGADGESALNGLETQEGPAGGSGTNNKALILIGAVVVIALGSAGWAWFHRASRYQPA